MHIIKENLIEIKENIQTACQKAGRDPREVTLVGVTKTIPVETIRKAYECGIRAVGENKAQELTAKYEPLADLPLDWHFIGHLQTNKVKYIVDKVKLIHSVDRLKLAQEIDRQCEQKGLRMDILVQVNISGETTKFGVEQEGTLRLIEDLAQLKNVSVKGLMTMAPYTENPEEVRSVFAGLKELADRISRQKIPGVEMKELSMGMTNDYPVAIEEGATIIRVGSGIFGQRQ